MLKYLKALFYSLGLYILGILLCALVGSALWVVCNNITNPGVFGVFILLSSFVIYELFGICLREIERGNL